MERMRGLAIGDAGLRSLQGLGKHLSAKDAAHAALLLAAAIYIGRALFDREQLDQPIDELLRVGGSGVVVIAHRRPAMGSGEGEVKPEAFAE
ncbi:hypothetical protein MACH05_11880 [Qipengyuania nanhaisediminis]